MREKFQLLMKNEGLTQSRLAEILEIKPAGISHILAGRNKPGFDLLQKILRRFPQLNPDWLLLDSDRMYRAEKNEEPTMPVTAQPKDGCSQNPVSNFDNLFSGVSNQPGAGVSTDTASSSETLPRETAASDKEVARVIVLYTDRSFESFTPQK